MRLDAMAIFGFCVFMAFACVPRTAQAHGDDFGFGAPADAAKATRVVKITMLDLAFQPAFVDVKRGETVRFDVTNTSSMDHDFTLGDTKAQAAHRSEMAEMAKMGDMATMHDAMHGSDPNAIFIKAGETKQLTWRFSTAAKIEFACNVPGHYEAGMKGTVNVHK